MSGFTEVRSYFRSNLTALGFKEWTDAFNVDNIPSTLIDKMFHIETPSGSRQDVYDMQTQDAEMDVVIRIVRKGYRNPASAVDTIISDLDTVLTRVLAPTRRIGDNIKNVVYSSHKIEPISDTNDNAVMLEINFICFIILCV
jgi:hypothetical protein